jgi:hypothetical protein
MATAVPSAIKVYSIGVLKTLPPLGISLISNSN